SKTVLPLASSRKRPQRVAVCLVNAHAAHVAPMVVLMSVYFALPMPFVKRADRSSRFCWVHAACGAPGATHLKFAWTSAAVIGSLDGQVLGPASGSGAASIGFLAS